MAEERPEYVKCIKHTHAEKQGEAWCGRQIECFEFAFGDIEHAAYNAIAEGRLLACPECVTAVAAALQNGQA